MLPSECPCILLENKSDLLEKNLLKERQKELNEFGSKNNFFKAFLVSALNSKEIKKCFKILLKECEAKGLYSEIIGKRIPVSPKPCPGEDAKAEGYKHFKVVMNRKVYHQFVEEESTILELIMKTILNLSKKDNSVENLKYVKVEYKNKKVNLNRSLKEFEEGSVFEINTLKKDKEEKMNYV